VLGRTWRGRRPFAGFLFLSAAQAVLRAACGRAAQGRKRLRNKREAPAELLRAEAVLAARWEPTRQREAARKAALPQSREARV